MGFSVVHKAAVVAVALLAVSGCSQGRMQKFTNYGQPGRVTCFTAAGVYFDDLSTGRIEKAASGADGFFFVAQSTGRLTEVTGDCVVDYGARVPAGWQAIRGLSDV